MLKLHYYVVIKKQWIKYRKMNWKSNSNIYMVPTVLILSHIVCGTTILSYNLNSRKAMVGNEK